MSFFINVPGELRVNGHAFVFPPGNANLSGTYDLSAAIDGDATLTGNTIIKGDLYISGAFFNQGGYSLEVYGDLIIKKQLNFTPSSTGTMQGNVTVRGDMVVGSGSITAGPVSGTVSADDFGGDLTTNVDFAAAGYVADGNITVTMTSGNDNGNVANNCNYGSPDSFTLNNVYTNSTGFYDHTGNTFTVSAQTHVINSSFRINAGQNVILSVGGNLYGDLLDCGGQDNTSGNGLNVNVNGNCFVNQLWVYGSFTNAGDAGNGGAVVIGGNSHGFIDAEGGNAQSGTGNGGNGGNVSIGGDMYESNIYSPGGAPGSSGSPQSAGNGGTVFVGGDCVAGFFSTVIDTHGEAGLNGGNSGNGGPITIIGDCVGNLFSRGGDNSSSAACGDGGTIAINGDFTGSSINSIGGGNSSSGSGNGGAGGNVSINGNCITTLGGSEGSVNVSGGGINTTGNGGASGNISVGGNGQGHMYANGGGAGGSSNGNGGNGGTIQFDGDLLLSSVSSVGGDGGTVGGAGHGGSLLIGGKFTGNGIHPAINTSGGSANTNGGGNNAGGVSIQLDCLGDIQANGGTTVGITTGGQDQFGTGPQAGSGGVVQIGGDFFGALQANGGDYNNCNSGLQAGSQFQHYYFAGCGGELQVGGNLSLSGDISLNGGNISNLTYTIDAGGSMTGIAGDSGRAGIGVFNGPGSTPEITVSVGGSANLNGYNINAKGGSVTGTLTGLTSIYGNNRVQAGNGGQISIAGYVQGAGSLDNSGGSASNGTHVDATNGGQLGQILIGGGSVANITSNIGSGTGAASTNLALTVLENAQVTGTLTINNGFVKLASNCLVGTLLNNGAKVQGNSADAMLTVGSTTGSNNTLWNAGPASATADISGNLSNSAFKYSQVEGFWYVLVGDSFGAASTTDATQTTAQSIATASDISYLLKVEVEARRTGGAAGTAGDSAVYQLVAMVKNVAGTVTVNGLSTPFASEDQPAWDATLDVSGTSVRVRVTGAANNNVSWKSTASLRRI